ncbi:hypothetical protein [Aliikangiella sp. G2MR2-5]|uniref:hypothetical protein n=1 Tax=Aliikangiella sp. G2MR2-5 TaxID=2788943 RepID=UPI0018AAF455|nr:hypothetical protein [Aliikangiella sp. G2MR2-5]
MKLTKIVLSILLLASALFITVSAEEECSNFDPEPQHFKKLYQESKELGKAICDSLGKTMDQESLVGQYVGFANKLEQTVEANFKTTGYYNALKVQVAYFRNLAALGVDKGTLPAFSVRESTTDLDDTNLYFHFVSWDTEGHVDSASPECQQAPTCGELLNALAIAINQYKEPYARLSAEAATKKITILRKSWDTYFEEARSQTLWDAIVTTKMEEDHLTQDRLVGPMQRQWFAAHPSIVVENVRDALDGSKTQQGLAVEWFGVNWWNKEASPIGVPFGISLASIYSSRPEVDDAGHGIMMTFNNALSIGWADHGGDDGYYVSIDFLSLLTEKKERWNDYKKRIKEFKFK